jgi:hypothetical protein
MHQLDSNSELLSLVFSVKITSLASGGKVGGRSGFWGCSPAYSTPVRIAHHISERGLIALIGRLSKQKYKHRRGRSKEQSKQTNSTVPSGDTAGKGCPRRHGPGGRPVV